MAYSFFITGFAKRQENRVLFNHQQTLADVLGYTGERLNDRIEQVMQRYFRTITELSRLNELLYNCFVKKFYLKIKNRLLRESTTVFKYVTAI